MKLLYIVRHAKSSWDFPDLDDHDRPLLEKGKKRTKRIIDFLLEKDVKVDFVISSTAVRALETARFIARAIGFPLDEIKADPAIYHASSERLNEQFFDLADQYGSVMIVGHNPAFTNFANQFIDPQIDWLPTSGVICVKFDTENWDKIFDAKCETVFTVYPRMLKGY